MIELQRRLAQDYQRQREAELNRQLAQTAIRDDTRTEQTMLVRRADVEGIGNGLHQMSGPAARDLQVADHVHVTEHSEQGHPRSATRGPPVAPSRPQPDVTGAGQYGEVHNRQQSDQVKLMPVNHGSATVDEFVQQLKSRNAK